MYTYRQYNRKEKPSDREYSEYCYQLMVSRETTGDNTVVDRTDKQPRRGKKGKRK